MKTKFHGFGKISFRVNDIHCYDWTPSLRVTKEMTFGEPCPEEIQHIDRESIALIIFLCQFHNILAGIFFRCLQTRALDVKISIF